MSRKVATAPVARVVRGLSFAPLLLTLLLLGTPERARAAGFRDKPAAYAQRDNGYVRITESQARTMVRASGRRSLESVIEVSFTVENRLDAQVILDGYELHYRQDSRDHVVRRHDGQFISPNGRAEVLGWEKVSSRGEVQGYSVLLTRYTVLAPTTRMLLRLASSQGAVDVAAAAQALSDLKPDRDSYLLEELRPLVAAGPESVGKQFGAGFAPLYALRLLGRLGTSQDVPLLLSALKSEEGYQRSRLWVDLARAATPEHPMMRLFASGAEPFPVVREALRDMRPEQAVPTLVTLAYTPSSLQAPARALLHEWKEEELVAALREPSGEAALQVLCASRQPNAVPLVVALGRAGVDVKACLTALPEEATVAELTRLLGDELGPFEATTYEVLAARARAALPVLQARAWKLGLPVEPEVETLARALRAALLSRELEALREHLAGVDAAVREGRYTAALETLEQGQRQARGPEQLRLVALGYARLGSAAARDLNEKHVDTALGRLGLWRSAQAPDADVDAELLTLARLLITQPLSGSQPPFSREGDRLRQLESVVGGATYPALARLYLEASDAPRREFYAKRALLLDAGNVAAKQVVEAAERERESQRQHHYAVLGGGSLFALGGVALFAVRQRRASSRRLALKKSAKEQLRAGMPSQQLEDLLVFQDGLSRGDAAILVKEAESDVRWGV